MAFPLLGLYLSFAAPVSAPATTRPHPGTAKRPVCEALMDGSIDEHSELALKTFADSFKRPAEVDLSVRLIRFDDLKSAFGSDILELNRDVLQLGSMRDAQMILRYDAIKSAEVAPAVMEFERSKANWDIQGRSSSATRLQSYRLSLFELRQARERSLLDGARVIAKAVSPNGYVYFALFDRGTPITTDLDTVSEIIPSLGLRPPAPKQPPKPKMPTRMRAQRVSPANAVQAWASAATRMPLTTISLPFKMTKSIQLSLFDIPLELDAFRDVRFAMGFTKMPLSVIPVWKDSGHSPFVNYIDGYQYVLSFKGEDARALFLEAFRKVSPVLLDSGEIQGRSPDESRFTVVLSPEQFQVLAVQFKVRGLPAEDDGFSATTWTEVKSLGWVHKQTTRAGVRYFFDRNHRVVALRRGGRFLRVRDEAKEIARNAASHVQILKRQRRGFGATTRKALESSVSKDLGMSVANEVVDGAEADLSGVMSQPEFAVLAGKVQDARIRLREAALAGRPLPNFLSRLLHYRLMALGHLARFDSSSIAGDVQAAGLNLCQHLTEGRTFESVLRFAWMPALSLGGGALLLSASGQTIHHQLFALALGRENLALTNPQNDLRGGLLRLTYDSSGRLESAVVIAGRMWTQIGADPEPVELVMSALEKQTLELGLLNWCQERYRDDQTMFAHGSNHWGSSWAR